MANRIMTRDSPSINIWSRATPAGPKEFSQAFKKINPESLQHHTFACHIIFHGLNTNTLVYISHL